jgi:hypothetical protein
MELKSCTPDSECLNCNASLCPPSSIWLFIRREPATIFLSKMRLTALLAISSILGSELGLAGFSTRGGLVQHQSSLSRRGTPPPTMSPPTSNEVWNVSRQVLRLMFKIVVDHLDRFYTGILPTYEMPGLPPQQVILPMPSARHILN